MAFLNALVGRSFDLLLFPFRQLPPIVGLLVVSLATAIAMLLIFKRTSDQQRLAAVKRQIHAALFEIRLFNDDLRAIFRAQGEILRHNLTYLRLSLVPMLWIVVPLVLVIAQLQFHYGYAGLQAGQAVLVKAHLRDRIERASRPVTADGAESTGDLEPAGALDAPAAIQVQTPAVWFPSTREIVWRIAPQAPGEYVLQVHVGGETFSKTALVSDDVARRSPVRLEQGFLNQLLYPAEPPLPAGAAVRAISVAYPDRSVGVFGWELHWLIVYFVLSMVFAFALRKQFGVTL